MGNYCFLEKATYSAWLVFFANDISLNCCVKSLSPCVRFVNLLIKENILALLKKKKKIHPIKWI